MSYRDDLEAVNKQIEELQNRKTELEEQIEQERMEAEKEKKQQRDKDLLAIKKSVESFNSTYNENLVLGLSSSKRKVADDTWEQIFYGTPFENIFR